MVASASSSAPAAPARVPATHIVGLTPSRRGYNTHSGWPASSALPGRARRAPLSSQASMNWASRLKLADPALPRAGWLPLFALSDALGRGAAGTGAGPWQAHAARPAGGPGGAPEPALHCSRPALASADRGTRSRTRTRCGCNARVVGAVCEVVRAVPLRVVERPTCSQLASVRSGLALGASHPLDVKGLQQQFRVASRLAVAISCSPSFQGECMFIPGDMYMPEVPFGDELDL